MSTGSFREGFHETPTEVRYAETDQMGYAHHSAAVVWFEMGRIAWMRAVGCPYRDLEARGYRMPVVRLTVRYHAPALFGDALVIGTRLIRLGRAIVAFENRVSRAEGDAARAGVLLAEGQVELACVGREGQIRRLPEELVERFSGYLHDTEAGPGQARAADG